MTHAETKINKTVLSLLLRTYKSLDNNGKKEFLMEFMFQFPQYYQEFIGYLDKTEYSKIVGQA